VCDQAETCTGSSTTCPADALAPASTVCRAAAGTCDIAENCSGTATTCPADVLRPSTFECRAAVAGGCDVAENCTGSAAACPTDVVNPSTTVCRAAAGVCDVAEVCSGTAATCPANAFEPGTTVCRDAADLCDAEETCTGSTATCPLDNVLPAGTLCRPVAGGCDVAESCSGGSTACPDDVFLTAGSSCRAPAGPCDTEETCPGSSAACPADELEPSSTVCRPAVGVCDSPESCTGTAVSCPTDVIMPNGTSCADGDPCTASETCLAGACQGGEPALAFDPTSITFPATFAGMMSTPVTVDLTNSGEAELVVNTITMTTGDYTATPPMGPPFTVADSGGTSTLDVVFAPVGGTIGTISDTITLNTAECTFELDVSGEARSADLTITPSDGDFGDILVGSSVDENYVVENAGSTDITVNTISIEVGDHFSRDLVNPTNLPATLEPGETVVLTVTAEPMVAGLVEDTLVIQFTPMGGNLITVNFPLSANGTVVDAGPPDVSNEPDAGEVDAGGPGLDDSYYTCNCRVGARAASADDTLWLVPLFGVGLLLLLRRRRR
jgi:MYXO-CTERM domain-containing protein